MPFEHLRDWRITLASGSPRRKELLKGLGLEFEVRVKPIDESYPNHLKREEIARYLAEAKASAFGDIGDNELIITADTIVCLDDEVLNKPADATEAFAMISSLSGRSHEVITGVALRSASQTIVFSETTEVTFHQLTRAEINWYIQQFQPFDKAGAYGIQEWIGFIGIQFINGDYFNVVGLPVQLLWQKLKDLNPTKG